MATPVKSLILVFVILLFCKGDCQCFPKDIEIVQSKTGAIVQQKPEWQVTINKNCPCVVLNASLVCPGFQTVEPVDPSIMQKQGDSCLLNRGEPVTKPISFSYAWDDSYPFKIDPGFQIACS